MRIRLTRLIGGALEAARRALRDLDADQIPASLRAVASHSGDLTPHLADRLARELDALDWLRERAREAWPDADVDAPSPSDRASALFLMRPDGWSVPFLAAAAETAGRAGAAQSGRSEREREALQRELAAARERERRWRKRAEDAEAEMRALRRRSGEPARADRAEVERAREALEAAQARWTEERAGLEEVVSRLGADVEALRDELYRSRRDRSEIVARLEEVRSGGAWAERDPLSLASFLDDAAAQARPRRRASAEAVAREHISPVLPRGVAPDEPRALDAVLGHSGPLLVVIDGYNAGLAMSRGTSSEVRTRLMAVLDRLVVVSSPAHRWCVVWDSSVGEAQAVRSGRLEARFADAGEPADDVVVALAASSESPVVVVSNDREVRERSEAVGAITLWSDALVRWEMERR